MGKLIQSKIVCTLGPATDSKEKIHELIDAGMNVARLNFSYGTHDYHKKVIENIRSVSDSVAILCDIQGPKIRIGDLEAPFSVAPDDFINITTEKVIGTKELISISYKGFLQDVKSGDLVYINDGLIKLVVENINLDKKMARCKVLLKKLESTG